MIRRDVPRQTQPLSHWLLISQIEHARISHQLAKAWQPEEIPSTARGEFLAAVLHHDDGWNDWQTAPRIDPEHGRPYGFTEMPPALAQEIWSLSIDACRALGPLAAWMVASHFIQLQSKPDDNLEAWQPWLDKQDRRRTAWLAEWQAIDSQNNTQAVADRCLYLLQQFDWLSLWLCCRAPVDSRDPRETLELGAAERNLGPYAFTPNGQQIEVSPWPFSEPKLEILANATWVEPGVYHTPSDILSKPTRAAWRLQPGNSGASG